mgnify:CR=1 FL=1
MSAAPLLSVQDLTVRFRADSGWMTAIEEVGFDLMQGENLGIVGESGSGKSVTALSILRLHARTTTAIPKGRILYDGRDLLTMPERELRAVRGGEIAMIFQEPMSSLSPVHTVGEQIMEVLRLHRAMSRRAARIRCVEPLDQVEIPEPAHAVDRYTFEFSGGMRQRVMIAMALACDPALLIADEPTTALDVTTQAEVLDLIRRLQREKGMAVMFITHDMGVVAEMADEVLVGYRGKIVEAGPVDGIFHAPSITVALSEDF